MNSAVIPAATTKLELRTSPTKGCVVVHHNVSWLHAKNTILA